MKKPYILIEVTRQNLDGRFYKSYQVHDETLARRFREDGEHVVEEAYNYDGWHQSSRIPYARILERFRWRKTANKAQRALQEVQKVMQS